jgi:predicted dehydrogenase
VTTSGESIRFAILGFGGAGRAHFRRLSALPGVRVVKVFDPVAGRAGQGPAGTAPFPVHDRLDGFFDDTVDAVSVCTPDHTHFAYAAEAVSRGLPTLVEKPMFVSREECDRMEALLRTSNALFGVHHQWRYAPTFRAARELVRAGALGEIVSVRADYVHDMRDRATRFDDWRVRAENPQNIVLGGVSHAIDVLRWILGQEVREAASFAARTGWKEYPDMDTAVALLRFSGGAIGSAGMTISSRGPQREDVTIYGTEGQIHGNVHRNASGRAVLTRVPPLRRARDRIFTALAPLLPRVPEFRDYPFYAYEHEVASRDLLADFVASIRGGTPFPVGFAEGRRAVESCLAVIESYRTGRVVTLPE